MSAEDQSVSNAIKALEDQERTLLDALKKIEDQLVRVRTARSALVALVTEEPMPFDGNLADAIRALLSRSKNSYKPVEVRDAVRTLGYTFKEDSNQMAAVHGVLKRLVESGDVKTKEWSKQPGITRYYWNRDQPPKAVSKVFNVTNPIIGGVYASRRPDVVELLNIKPKKSDSLLAKLYGPGPKKDGER